MIARFIRSILGSMYRKKALQGMRHLDPAARQGGMPRGLRGVRP
jgi:hypothetical protein